MIERTALRIATVMALSNGFAEPYPTMARGRVYDSRMDPLQAVDEAEVIPMITVAIDDDSGDSMSENNGGPPFLHDVKLVLEISMGVVGEDPETQARAIVPMPHTEPELEALLDLMERQVKAALVHPTAPWTRELGKTHRGIIDWASQHYVEANANVRLAARRMIATVRMPVEDLHTVALAGAAVAPAAVPPPLGPLLATIAASASPWAPAAASLQTALLAAGAGGVVTLPELLRVRLIEAAQAQTNLAGTPRGPRAAGVAQATLPT